MHACCCAQVVCAFAIFFIFIFGGGNSLRFARRRYHKSHFSISGLPMIISYGRFLKILKVKGTLSATVSLLDLFISLLKLFVGNSMGAGNVKNATMKCEDNWHCPKAPQTFVGWACKKAFFAG